MAIYHCSTKPLSRSAGRSAVAAAAYRSGEKLEDKRTGLVHNYTNRSGVMDSYTLLPSGESCDRSELWNKAEDAEKRKDARTAREWVIAIPSDIVPKDEPDREFFTGSPDFELVKDFAEHLSQTYGTAVDVAIHSPDKKGDNRNYHAHILTTTRKVKFQNDELVFGDKASIELSDKKRGELKLGKAKEDVRRIRETWANLANRKLEEQNKETRIDHRSLKDQGIDRIPQIHVGVTANNMERKGKATERGNQNNEIKKLNAEIIDLERERQYRKKLQKRNQEQQQREQQKKPQPEQAERKNAELATEEKQEEQKQQETSTPEQVKTTYEDLLHAEIQAVIKKAQPIYQKVRSKFCTAAEIWHSKQPDAPSGLLSLFRKKAYERDLQTWQNNKEKAGRIMRVYRQREEMLKKATYSSYGDRYLTLADKVAMARIKRSYPELSSQYKAIKERENKQQQAEQLEKRKRLDREREAKRKERELARRRNGRRGRGWGDGGLSR